ncbi:poly(ADP-ribose) polymerase catalytic domain-containing protein [Ditylenchus destructor]|uniref:Poly [ADP-ribose] polymerase n=1 Tax=Ditylenchus destructor TaxID=166010 RepID=A0AAD4N000_9BILA|nr:poly(ADP-ribose) polymerase catalytic domain-containing protein [Ditylenchus destructor]
MSGKEVSSKKRSKKGEDSKKETQDEETPKKVTQKKESPKKETPKTEGVSQSAERQELPYAAEYAKSGRAGCKGCKEPIAQGSLRMAVRFPSRFFDGWQDNWFHFGCFWRRVKKSNMNETAIRGMEWLKWEDQETIRKRILDLEDLPDDFGTPRSAAPKVEHAKSAAGKCFQCKEKIQKGEMRIAYKSSFYHTNCFKDLNEFHKSAEDITGYELLEDDEKSQLKELFSAAMEDKNGEPSKKKAKIAVDPDTRTQLKKQTDILWEVRQELSDNLHKDEMEELLKANGRYKPKKGGNDAMLDILCDCIVFGVPEKCPECGGLLMFSSIHAYKCKGHVSEYTPCAYSTKVPTRTCFKVSKLLRKKHEFLANIESPKLKCRVYAPISETEQPITVAKSFERLNTVGKEAKKPGKSKSGKSELEERGSKKMVVKHGCVVDPSCEVSETTHVYIDPETKLPWQATLGMADVLSGKNSFYKLQLLKSDKTNEYYVFRAWGRVGTEVGGTKLEDFGPDLDDAKESFEKQFLDKTRNEWKNRHNFKKHPFALDIIELDYDGKDDKHDLPALDVESSKSSLPKQIKNLIAMIFDIDAMTATMKEFEIDMEKMPLGKLSRKHILNAYSVLTQLQKLIEEGQPSYNDYLDATNRFYTLIPHNHGLASPPLLNTKEMIKSKAEMLDNLLEMEIAYNIIKSEASEMTDPKKDMFDIHYEKLNCNMEVLEKESEEFKLVKEYAKNTHGATHESYKLDIIEVMKVNREGEDDKFKADVGNRHLLWHGSRTSNYVGILSQGLRIAPPEAPVTGYMFGKGIYTADMVSKSANYCHALDADGLLLLCDVALGEIQEERRAKNIRKLKPGKHSVKGVGSTMPDPTKTVEKDGVKIPLGTPVTSDEKGLDLIYNEYIVYDENQVRLKYLVRAKFLSK